MLTKTNIETRLKARRNRRMSPETILDQVKEIWQQEAEQRTRIEESLATSAPGKPVHSFQFDLLEADRIFHLTDIKNICIDYRLRFLDASFFKGEIPEEAITKIRQLEKQHQNELSEFKVIAPSKRLKLENADDPLLFVPLGNDYFYLVHKWGNDLHPLRRWLMWPYKSFENLVFAVFILSILLTALTPMELFTKQVNMQEYVLMFLFMFKAVGGIVLFYGFAKGKNFNTAIWNSKYYNA